MLLYMPTFARVQLHLPLDQAFAAQAIGLVCMIALIPFFGAWSDRVGRKRIIVGALIVYLIVIYPLFSWGAQQSLAWYIIDCTDCAVLSACCLFWSTLDCSGRVVRCQGSLDWAWHRLQWSRHDFRRLRSVFCTWLIQVIGSPVAPSYYVMFGAAVGILGALFLWIAAGISVFRRWRPSCHALKRHELRRGASGASSKIRSLTPPRASLSCQNIKSLH
jgi:MHS family proline/betaine transporter-like MFS transporter